MNDSLGALRHSSGASDTTVWLPMAFLTQSTKRGLEASLDKTRSQVAWERQVRQHRRGMTKRGCASIMREHRTEAALSHAGIQRMGDRCKRQAIGLRGSIDNSMGGYFNHRNNAGARSEVITHA